MPYLNSNHMETLTVRIQGESDWLEPLLYVKELNKLKDQKTDKAALSLAMGKLLDIGVEKLTEENKNTVITLLANYVANLKVRKPTKLTT